MRFTQPIWLLLLIPVLVGLWLGYRELRGMASWRRKTSLAIRILVCTALIFAAAGAQIVRKNSGLCTYFLVDRSDSIDDTSKKLQEEFIKKAASSLKGDDQVGVIVFGKDAVVEAAPGSSKAVGKFLSTIDGRATDVAMAIRLASASFPEGKGRRIVLLTDGIETTGDVKAAADTARVDGISIDTLPLQREAPAGEAMVTALDAPSSSRIDQPVQLRAVVESTVEQEATLELTRDGALISKTSVHLTGGQNQFLLPDKVRDFGFHRYAVRLNATKDTDTRNNIGGAFVQTKGKPQVLILQEPKTSPDLKNALVKNGINVVTANAGSMPVRREEIESYDAVIFNDFNGANMDPATMKIYTNAARDGGVGLAMIGGENSFLSGGYFGTPIAEALPVDLNLKSRKSFPSTSVCIIMDTSGSMSMIEDGVAKYKLAAQASEKTMEMVSSYSRVAVAGSCEAIEFVLPMQTITNLDAARSQIRTLTPGSGGIYCEPSLLKGEEVLMKEPSEARHFILLSDGNDAQQQNGCFEIAHRLLMNKITLSVVAIGRGKDESFLHDLAAAGGGKYFLADKASKLPAIFTQDTAMMGRSAIEEGQIIPQVYFGDESLNGIDGVPTMRGYNVTSKRPLAQMVMESTKKDPLMARWQYGLATTLVYTSDAQSHWGANWIGWPSFGAFWSQSIRSISRRASSQPYQVTTHFEGGKAKITVQSDGNADPKLSLHITSPDGTSISPELTQQGVGKYTADFSPDSTGSYFISVAEARSDGKAGVSTSGLSVPYPPEYQFLRPNKPLLASLSKLTNGQTLTPSDAEKTLAPLTRPGESSAPLAAFLIALSTFLWPLDIALRRVTIPLGALASLFKIQRSQTATATRTVVTNRVAKARSQRPTRQADPQFKIEKLETSRRVEEPTPVQNVASREVSSGPSSKLLEAKRKRQEDESSPKS